MTGQPDEPTEWTTRPVQTGLVAAATVVLAAAVLFVDTPGKLLVGGAAVVAAGVAVRDLVLRPRLAATGDGVVVRTAGGTRTIAWPQLRARLRTSRRLGLRNTTLELEDTGDDAVLVVLGRRDLGTDPGSVAAQLLRRTGPVPEDG